MSEQQYDNTNSGLLYRNEDKKAADANPKWPDFKGSVNIDGTEYWLSGWVKTGRDGTKLAGRQFFSLAVKPKEAPAPKSATTPGTDPEFNDDIPF